MNFIAAIVTFNPDVSRLRENIESVSHISPHVLLVDNKSDNIEEIAQLASCYENVRIIRNEDNLGMAKALNQEAVYATENGYDWLLSLDQDSVIPDGLIAEYEKYISDSGIGMLTCKIVDRNFGEMKQNAVKTSGVEEVKTCITSASLLRLSAWKSVGGYYEPYFIDSVDFDMCYLLREHGYKILRTNNVSLLHEVGRSKVVSLLGRQYQVFNHSPLRNYYMYRNAILLAKRHHFMLRQAVHLLRSIVVLNIFEGNRMSKNKMIVKGIAHGIKGKYGKY